MSASSRERTQALLAAARAEMESLAARSVRIEGNAFSSIILVKGDLNERERGGAALLSGADGQALRAALLRLGYPPEDFCALGAVDTAGEPLDALVFREALEALDPEAVALLDDAAAHAMREAYADALAAIEQFEVAMLEPGLVAHVLGRRVLALDGFEAALADPRAKQRMWAYLKQIPPAGAPY